MVGAKCDQCKPGYFNLQPYNPEGCTECFCFGVSFSCKTAGYGIAEVRNVSHVRLLAMESLR